MYYQRFLTVINMKLQTLLVMLVWSSELYCVEYKLKEKFTWGQLDFQFPNESARIQALATNSYIPEKNVIWAIGVWKDKIFASVFRHNLGVASSFNYFSIHADTQSPVIIPYPSYDANYVPSGLYERPTYNLRSNSSITSTAYFKIDYKCDRLWIIDSGVDDFFGTRVQLTPPALVIFDLNTDKLIRRYTIPDKFVNSSSSIVSVEVDINKKCCDDAFAYMADMTNYVIVVYSFKRNRSWRLAHKYFGIEPGAGNFVYGDIIFEWNFGIVGITVGERHKDGSRRVYLKPYATTKTYYISNKILQDELYIVSNMYSDDVHLLGDRGEDAQILRYVYDKKTKVLFDSLLVQQRIECWNTAKSFQNSNFGVLFTSNELFFSTDVTIDKHRNLWMLTNNFPVFQYGCWDEENNNNIRIYKGSIDKLISGTVCEK